MEFQSINPATGEVLNAYSAHTSEQVESILRGCKTAFRDWSVTSFSHRSRLMKNSANALRKHRDRFAELISLEMGKPVRQSRSEVEKCAWVCDYYAEESERILSPETIGSDASKSYARFDPLGVILAVMPWNFPFWQVFRFAAPALMAGNTGVLKHASNVPGCALAIEAVFHEAGFPEEAFRTLLIGSGAVQAVIENSAIAAVTLTGSEKAGAEVAAVSGRNLKKTVMELGGSDPYIVLRGADLAKAASTAATARMMNTGQSCIAAKRFIVEQTVAQDFQHLFREAVAAMVVGDPLDEATDVGPLARADLLDDLDRQVERSVAMGATTLIGGKRREGRGCYYEPSILANTGKGMPAFDEELFGPVAAVTTVAGVDEAVACANDSIYGLGASLWTSDLELAERCAGRIESGSVFINGMVKSDPRLPFGGIKNSGYGRELSHYGIKEFVNIKTVWIA